MASTTEDVILAFPKTHLRLRDYANEWGSYYNLGVTKKPFLENYEFFPSRTKLTRALLPLKPNINIKRKRDMDK